MNNLTKLLIAVGIILILSAVVLRVTMIPIIVSGMKIKPSSMLIVANTAFLLALLTRK